MSLYSDDSSSSHGLDSDTDKNENTFWAFYSRPDAINNISLVANRQRMVQHSNGKYSYPLKNNVAEIHDYVKVHQSLWTLLKQWYGYDYEILL